MHLKKEDISTPRECLRSVNCFPIWKYTLIYKEPSTVRESKFIPLYHQVQGVSWLKIVVSRGSVSAEAL